MADTRLNEFIESALRAGKGREEISEALASAGWSNEQIQDGFQFFAEVPFEIPVPKPRAQLSARDAYFYLLLFGTLYLSAYQFGSLLFAIINVSLPDGLDQYWEQRNQRDIRWATASLIIAFPVAFWLHMKLQREVTRDPARRQSAVRRWLTYLTLLIAAGVVVGDLITLIYNLLSGDLTLRFVLKVLVVATIAGSAFLYCLGLVREDDVEPAT